jgi:hypothetical protein
VGREEWAEIGRSLVLSIIALSESSGPLTVASDGSIAGSPGGSVLSSGRVYRLLRQGEYQPRAVSIGRASGGIWTWTVASAVRAAYSQNEEGNTILDISVSFPAGETHYMIIRGIRPFIQLQLYDIPFRTDPQFERYDSSGWSYSASEQTLVLKMKHRISTEHIEIFY